MSECISKKVDGYGLKSEDVVIEKELTVTITLHEYRNLIKEVSIKEHEIDKIRSEKWKLESEVNKLKEKLLDKFTDEEEEEC